MSAKRRRKKKKSAGRKAFRVLVVLLALLLFGYLFLNYFLNKIQREDPNDTEQSDVWDDDADEVFWKEVGPLMDDELLNILLIGQDRRPGEGRERSDAMLLCSLNVKTKEVSVISFMRDLYVEIPGYKDDRLNVPYVLGGCELLKETLKTNFGVTVDGCFEVDFNGFKEVIDLAGGVDVELTEKEAGGVGNGDVEGMNHLEEANVYLETFGENTHLNGRQALAYARIRKLDSDFGRTQRQRTVMMSLYNSLKTSSLRELMAIANKMLPLLTTDMTNAQIMAILMKVLPLMKNLDVQTYCVPSGDAYYNASVDGKAVLMPDRDRIQQQLREEYLPFADRDRTPAPVEEN